jgi:hypothetical protein
MKQNVWHLSTFLLLALIFLLGAMGELAMAGDKETFLMEMVRHLPEEVEGWRKADCEVYGPENLYRYINGGAELYISFQFTTLVSQPYLDVDGNELRFDIFDMGSPENAFGVFCHSRETIDDFIAPDVESEYVSGLLHFWKGRYYASVLGYPETATKKAAIQALAQKIAAQIDAESNRPAIVALLPESDLVPYSIRYFRHHAWINDYHHFSDENLLNVAANTEVAMAKIRPSAADTKPAVLLTVQYPTADAAEAAEQQFTRVLLPTASDGLQEDDDGSWLGCLRAHDLLVVVADTPDQKTARQLLENCVQRHREN